MKWKEILQDEWEIRPCWTGAECWCRRICTKSGTEIVGGAGIVKELASYFVALHNKKLRDERGYYSNIHNIQYRKFEDMVIYDDNGLGHRNQLNQKWKVGKCGARKCWCRIIKNRYGLCIVHAASLGKQEAEYFVKLHNNFLKEKKKWQ